MRQQSDWTLSVGCAALLAALILSLPGVQAVRADDDVVEVVAAINDFGPSCDAQSVTHQPIIRVHLPKIASAGQGSDSVPVALNNRGLGYGPDAFRPAADPDNR